MAQALGTDDEACGILFRWPQTILLLDNLLSRHASLSPTSSALQACKCLLSSRWLACPLIPLLAVSLVVSALACANAGEYDIDGIN